MLQGWFARTFVNGPDGLVEKDTKTHQARRVTLDPATVAVLAAHREWAEYRARLAHVECSSGALLFSRDGLGEEPWYPDSITRRFHRLCGRAGLEGGVRLMISAAYVATQLLAAGVDVRTVAGRLGHRNAATIQSDACAAPSHWVDDAPVPHMNPAGHVMMRAEARPRQPSVPSVPPRRTSG